MSGCRMKLEGEGFYHVISRVVDKAYKLDDGEKRILLGEIRRAAAFSGVEVYAHALMDNHFHLLVRVPERKEIGEEELRRRLLALYGEEAFEKIVRRWERWEKIGAGEAVEEDKARYRKRMHDLSQFVKTFKEWYTMDYNKRKKRSGTLWESRFKSVAVEGSQEALLTVAGYIHMNPVRAGMAEKARAAGNTSLGAGMAGEGASRAGLLSMLERLTGRLAGRWGWGEALEVLEGAIEDKDGLAKGGLPVSELVAKRRAAFSNGVAIGGEGFVAAVRERMPLRKAERSKGALSRCVALGLDTAGRVKEYE